MVQNQLIDPRNDAARGGATLSKQDAASAVEVATAIVEMALPLRDRLRPAIFPTIRRQSRDHWLNDDVLVQLVRSYQHEQACPAITSI